MATSEAKLTLLDYYFSNRHLDNVQPTAQDFDGKFSPAELNTISSQLADQGFISWSAQGGEAGSGRITFKGLVTCVEPRFKAPEIRDEPKPQPAPPKPAAVTENIISPPAPPPPAAPAENTITQPAPTEAGNFYDRSAVFFPRLLSHKQTTKQTKQQHGPIHQTTRSTRARQTSRSRREDSRRFVPSGYRQRKATRG